MLAAAVLFLGALFWTPAFVSAPKRQSSFEQKLALAGAAALPILGAMEAAEAEVRGKPSSTGPIPFGEAVTGGGLLDHTRSWSIVLVPMTTLVMPGIGMGLFVFYIYSDDFFYRTIPNHPKNVEAKKAWKRLPGFADYDEPMNGFVDREDWESGLVAAWEKMKPKGSKLDAKQYLKKLATQNNPHAISKKVWNVAPGSGPYTSMEDYEKGLYPKAPDSM